MPSHSGHSKSERQRRQRLAAALRENLKRRKAQARGRQGAAVQQAAHCPGNEENSGKEA